MTRRWIEGIENRLNPVFWKDLRQTMGGWGFVVFFVLMISALVAISMLLLIGVENENKVGQHLFLVVYSLLCFGVMVVIPAQVILSTHGRWALPKVKLMQLTALSPLQLVVGRFLSAGAQATLLTAAVMPFLLLSFLLPGMKFALVKVLSVQTIVHFLLAVSCSIGLSWLSNHRLFHSFISLTCIFFCFLLFVASVYPLPMILQDIPSHEMINFYVVMMSFDTYAISVALLMLSIAVISLRHPEENRSTPLRVGLLCTTVALILSAGVFTGMMDKTSDKEIGWIYLAFTFISLHPFFFIILTEPNRMGKRVCLDVQRKKLPFAGFFAPSGGSAVLFTFHLCLIVAICGAYIYMLGGKTRPHFVSTFLSSLFFFLSFLFLIPSFFGSWYHYRWARFLAVLVNVLLWCGACLIPYVIRAVLVLPNDSGIVMLSPMWQISSYARYGRTIPWVEIALLLIALLCNLQRVRTSLVHLRRLRNSSVTST